MSNLSVVLEAHQQAVQEFVAAARAVPSVQWGQSRADGKWSPGQITEHLALAYDASRNALRGRAPGPASPRLLRPLIRALLLRPVLWFRRFPPGSKSPAPLRPGAVPAPAPVLLDRLRAAAAALERDALAAQNGTIEHPAFGRMPIVDLIRLQEVHTRHHCGQLSPKARAVG